MLGDTPAGGGRRLSMSPTGPNDNTPTVFHWRGGGRHVFLALADDDWETRLPMSKSGAEFSAIIDLPPGIHHYQFIVDGVWQSARDQPLETSPDGAVVNVMDSRVGDTVLNGPRGSPPGKYDCRMVSQEDYRTGKEPPNLPPQLHSAILNSAPVGDALLPVPAHVVLNHLYSCCRTDGVACLGTTHRYRTKFVTTVLYTRIVTRQSPAAPTRAVAGAAAGV
jgi:5'-AMP-activated protein kinase regulatory beta subunit